MHELALQNPRYGYRRITALLRSEGWSVNRKRIERLWRAEGLKVPQRQRKRRRLGDRTNAATRKSPQHRNHVWSYDFLCDQTEDGRRLKFLPILDEFTRESLTICVARSITADDVIGALDELVVRHGAPSYIRSDNGPEFVANKIQTWIAAIGAQTLYIEPGSPWQNPYSESFNARFRDELLDRELFSNLIEAQVLVEDWRNNYNRARPHSSLGYLTPTAFAATLPASSPRGYAPRSFGGQPQSNTDSH